MMSTGIRRKKRFDVLALISVSIGFSLYLVFFPTIVVDASDPPLALELKLGLWEVTTINGDETMPVPASVLEKLTPEQRARLQERLTARSQVQGVPSTKRQCVTLKELSAGVPFLPYRSCRRTSLHSAEQSFTLSIQCQDEAVQREGTLHIEVIDATTVRGAWRLRAKPNDHTRDSAHSFLAVWKSSQCDPG